MKKTFTATHILAACVSASMVLYGVACSSGAATSDPPMGSTASGYSGSDVFKGVFFQDGPLAAFLGDGREAAGGHVRPTLESSIAQLEYSIARMKAEGWSASVIDRAQGALDTLRSGGHVDQATPEQSATTKELLLAEINATDPTFLDRFGVEMLSGDHLRVEAAMSDAESRIKAAVNTLGAAPSPGSSVDGKCLIVYQNVLVDTQTVRIIGADSASGGRLGHAETIDRLTSLAKLGK
jgi:hypothetical protein